VWSLEHDTSRLPSGVTARALTLPPWPAKLARSVLLSTSHTESVPASEPDTTVVPSGNAATAPTFASCGARVDSTLPLATSHTFTELPSPVTSRPWDVTATALTPAACPRKLPIARRRSRSQTLSVPSSDADTTRRPFAVTARLLTQSSCPASVATSWP